MQYPEVDKGATSRKPGTERRWQNCRRVISDVDGLGCKQAKGRDHQRRVCKAANEGKTLRNLRSKQPSSNPATLGGLEFITDIAADMLVRASITPLPENKLCARAASPTASQSEDFEAPGVWASCLLGKTAFRGSRATRTACESIRRDVLAPDSLCSTGYIHLHCD